MLITVRILAILLPAVALIEAQPEAPLFRAGTKLVEVTVTVRDRKGSAVPGMRASDFTVLDGGKPRPVAFFRFDGAPEAPLAAAGKPRPPAGVYTNRGDVSGGAPLNITALVLDTMNTPPQGSSMARAQMMRYLKALTPETRVAIFHMGQELRVLHDFTDDAAALRGRLEKAVLGMPLESISDFERSVAEAQQFIGMFGDDPQAQEAMVQMKTVELEAEMRANAAARRSRMERSLASIEALGHHMAGIPGRKNVVWISGGFTMVSVQGAFGVGARGGFDEYEGQVRQTARRLAQDGVVLYIVNAEGLTGLPNSQSAAVSTPASIRSSRGRFERQVDAERFSNDPHSAMELMASVTGGRYLHDTNDLASGFKQTIADLRGSYTLGFYVPEEPDGKWHKLRVRVNRRGVTVRHREGYLAEAAAARPVEWDEETWKAALSNPVTSSAIPLTARKGTTAAGELVLSISTDCNALDFRHDAGNLKADLKIAVAEMTVEGITRTHYSVLAGTVPAAKWGAARAEGVPFRRQWRPAPDVTTVRVIVLDLHTGRYGGLEVPLGSDR